MTGCGAPPVVVIGEALWRRRFGADPSMLGRMLELNRAPFTVVGVTAASGSASALGAGVDAWAPLAQGDACSAPGGASDLDGAVVLRVRAAVDARSPRSRRVCPAPPRSWGNGTPELWRATHRSAPMRAPCSSGASAPAARLIVDSRRLVGAHPGRGYGQRRRRAAGHGRGGRAPTAIHLSMGAGRAAIARRLLFEGRCLGGWAAAWRGLYLWPAGVRRNRVASDAGAQAGAAARPRPSLAAMWLFAVVVGGLLASGPALWARAGQPDGGAGRRTPRGVGGRRSRDAARAGGHAVRGVAGARGRRRAVLAQSRDAGRRRRRIPRAGLVAMDFDLEPRARRWTTRGAGARRARRTAAASGRDWRRDVEPRAGRSIHAGRGGAARARRRGRGRREPVPGDRGLLRPPSAVPLVAGRAFTEDECDARPDVVIVNESLARRLWPGGDAIGRALGRRPRRAQSVRVVGVATRLEVPLDRGGRAAAPLSPDARQASI